MKKTLENILVNNSENYKSGNTRENTWIFEIWIISCIYIVLNFSNNYVDWKLSDDHRIPTNEKFTKNKRPVKKLVFNMFNRKTHFYLQFITRKKRNHFHLNGIQKVKILIEIGTMQCTRVKTIRTPSIHVLVSNRL